MTITPILNIQRQKWGALGVIQLIYDGVFVCKCKLFSDIIKSTTSNAFVYDSHFSQNKMSKCCGAIIDNRYHALICVLEEKYKNEHMH